MSHNMQSKENSARKCHIVSILGALKQETLSETSFMKHFYYMAKGVIIVL